MIGLASTSAAGKVHKYCGRHEYADRRNCGWRHTASKFTQATGQASAEEGEGGCTAFEASQNTADTDQVEFADDMIVRSWL